MTAPLLSVQDVAKTYRRGGPLLGRRFRAVDGVSLEIAADVPEIVAVIGESGSGKTTLARMILKMVEPSAGSIRFRGTELSSIRGRAARLGFMRQVQPIFQNPFEAFNPLKRVDRYLFATARGFGRAADAASAERAADTALRQVGLSLAEVKGRFPHELSGGQLQRVAIARALIPGPALIVADEPVSMVDASLRMAIVALFRTLRDTLRVSILYITHDLATAYHLSDRVAIMRHGAIVETGAARTVLDNAQHPYSILLRQSVLSPDTAPHP
ncbi:MAG: ABC transporter ATP-binding protein [Alphaproteobacteria bacterium]|nr:ABC transporter ATP-binding protein [Alphaproteobacteria bacterium]